MRRVKTHRFGWALAEDPNWREKAVEVEKAYLSIHGTKTATPALDFVSPLLSALYISLPLVLKTRRKLARKVSIHSRPAKVTLSAIYKTFIRAEITNQYPLPGST